MVRVPGIARRSRVDELQTTPKLLDGVTIGDIQTIGFASRGETNWVLAGYEIQVNGELFVANRGMSQPIDGRHEEDRLYLEEAMPRLKTMEQELKDQEAFVKADDTEKNRAELEEKRKQVSEFSKPIVAPAGRLAGTHPWYVEQDDGLSLASPPEKSDAPLSVGLITVSAASPRSRNPLYLKVGGRKFPLSSPSQPLDDEPKLQTFDIVPVASAVPRMGDEFAIGMLGHDDPFDKTPDRAQLQRVVVRSGENVAYDSDTQPIDSATLRKVALLPPAHRDDKRLVVTNAASPRELFLWQPGYKLPDDAPTTQDETTLSRERKQETVSERKKTAVLAK